MDIEKPETIRVFFETLGCKVNQCESEAMAALFQNAGYNITEDSSFADIYIINTCTVTHISDRKSRQMIRRALERENKPVVVVCGCYAQNDMEEVAALGDVDIIIGINQHTHIVEAVETYLKNHQRKAYIATKNEMAVFEEFSEDRLITMSRAYLKVQEGCNQFCTYCIIPYARGPLRSRKMENIISEAQKLEAQGFNEIILTGTHIGKYGVEESSEGYDLADVCQKLLDETNIPRIRLGSIEVSEISDKLLEIYQNNPRMCRHFHIPLQAGQDDILKRMGRPYTTEEFRRVVEKIRVMIEDVAITTDYMVGFPGETDDQFRSCLMFCDEISFADMHIFKYSPREGTPAANFDQQIATGMKDKRSKSIQVVAEKHSLRFLERFIGKEISILLEEKNKNGQWEGHTDNYLKALYTGEGKKGEIVQAKVVSVTNKKCLLTEPMA